MKYVNGKDLINSDLTEALQTLGTHRIEGLPHITPCKMWITCSLKWISIFIYHIRSSKVIHERMQNKQNKELITFETISFETKQRAFDFLNSIYENLVIDN